MAVDPNSLPLRDRLRHAEKLVRELHDHLDSGYLKHVKELQRCTESDANPVGDMTVRMGVARILEADETTERIWKETRLSLQSIRAEFERILREGG